MLSILLSNFMQLEILIDVICELQEALLKFSATVQSEDTE